MHRFRCSGCGRTLLMYEDFALRPGRRIEIQCKSYDRSGKRRCNTVNRLEGHELGIAGSVVTDEQPSLTRAAVGA